MLPSTVFIQPLSLVQECLCFQEGVSFRQGYELQWEFFTVWVLVHLVGGMTITVALVPGTLLRLHVQWEGLGESHGIPYTLILQYILYILCCTYSTNLIGHLPPEHSELWYRLWDGEFLQLEKLHQLDRSCSVLACCCLASIDWNGSTCSCFRMQTCSETKISLQ